MRCRHCMHIENSEHPGVTIERCCRCGEAEMYRTPELLADGHGKYLRRMAPPEPDRGIREAYLIAAGM